MRAMLDNNNKTHRLTMALLISLLLAACSNSTTVSSSDRRVSFEFCTDRNGAPCYAFKFSETTLESRLAAGGGTAIRFRPAEKAATL